MSDQERLYSQSIDPETPWTIQLSLRTWRAISDTLDKHGDWWLANPIKNQLAAEDRQNQTSTEETK